MQPGKPQSSVISRRAFLHAALLGSSGLALTACGAELGAATPPITPTPGATATPVPSGPKAIAGDVLDYGFDNSSWPGDFGWVRLRLHEARHDGQAVFYIRTDASEEDFAKQEGLVWMPLLVAGKEAEFENKLYLFDDGRPPVMRSIPGQEPYLSLFEIIHVHGGDGLDLASVAALKQAEAAGQVDLEASGVFVNFPVVKWPGGELPIDRERDSYLGTGQLLAPLDLERMEVTMKLHEGFPSSWYILTDTSAVDRSEQMHIAPAASSWNTTKYNATDELFVFANGIPGSGVMGFQPAVFGSSVASRVSSPFWNHFTVRWNFEENARVLSNSREVYEAIERGELIKLNGVPDSHPNGFVVNCPVVVLADNRTS